MILEALHTTLNAVMESHALIGDIEAKTPFCVFSADAAPVRDKDSDTDYRYVVEIGIYDADIADVNTKTEAIKTAMLAMNGTINGTEIVAVLDSDESGVYYSNPNAVYINDLEFIVFTTNR